MGGTSTERNKALESDSNTVNDLLMNKTIPITLHNNFLTFSDTDKKLELERHLLKMMANKNYNVNPANLPDKKNEV